MRRVLDAGIAAIALLVAPAVVTTELHGSNTGPASPPASHERAVTGRIARYDASTHTLVIDTGSHEERFVVTTVSVIQQGSRRLRADELSSYVGRKAKVRFSKQGATQTAELVMVSRDANPPRKGS